MENEQQVPARRQREIDVDNDDEQELRLVIKDPATGEELEYTPNQRLQFLDIIRADAQPRLHVPEDVLVVDTEAAANKSGADLNWLNHCTVRAKLEGHEGHHCIVCHYLALLTAFASPSAPPTRGTPSRTKSSTTT